MKTHKISWQTYLMPPLHPEGPKFIIIFGIIALIFLLISGFLGLIGIVLTIWCFYFFRDPERYAPEDHSSMVSPADGIVQMIEEVEVPAELEMKKEKLTRISIFMSVFNCHVNRMPMEGKVKETVYVPGKYFNATLDKASKDNERQILRIEMGKGQEYVVVQIAGLVARRIVCDAQEGDTLKTGQRFGIIRFGSRLDVYLPKGVKPLVQLGQTMVAGETVIAKL